MLPALPPRMPSFALDVYFRSIRYSAQAMKSFQVLGFEGGDLVSSIAGADPWRVGLADGGKRRGVECDLWTR
jgi:hypothetical protein